jgi:hypothetical protein
MVSKSYKKNTIPYMQRENVICGYVSPIVNLGLLCRGKYR